jgi:large subunit ribosomal protein L4
VEIAVYNQQGEIVRRISVSDDVFGVPANEALMHQAMVRQRANARQGTADTKDRGEVHGSNKKLFAQKHTGNARQGSSRSPLRRHGGVVFGPHPRDYRQEMPKQMRRLAIRCALSSKAGADQIIILENLALEAPKTKDMVAILAALKANKTALIATRTPDENIIKSARNIPGVKTTPADLLNFIDVITYEKILMTEEAVRRVEGLWGKKSAGAGA